MIGIGEIAGSGDRAVGNPAQLARWRAATFRSPRRIVDE